MEPQQTVRYLNQVFGGESVRVALSARTDQLPYFLQDTYEVLLCELLGRPITLACLKGHQPLAAHQVDQHAKRLRDLLQAPVIVALKATTPGERKQLIAHGVAFVVPDRQLFAPEIGMILTERFGAEPRREQELVSPATQAEQRARQTGIFFEPRTIADGIAVQVWRYEPGMQAKKITVDPLSLWLSLEVNPDDRIQMALDEIEEKFPW